MQDRKRLVIVGSGFAAFSLLKKIDLRHYDLTVVSKRNYFLYTPLLPSTVVGTVEFRNVIESLRGFRDGVNFVLGSVTGVDPDAKKIQCRSEDKTESANSKAWDMDYDVLAIAVGADCQTFGIPGVPEHCCFLKELSDARKVRSTVIDCLERASLPEITNEEKDELLHFIAVGAGATGVRFAAELSDLLNRELRKNYADVVDRVRITLLDAGTTVLGSYDRSLQEYTVRHFQRQNISIRTECFVAEVRPNEIELKSGEVLKAGVILWSTGFAPSKFVRDLPFEKAKSGRIQTDDFLRVKHQSNIYAMGDCASPVGKDYPQLAQVAEQQGRFLAKHLNYHAMGRTVKPFVWKNLGISSYIGDCRAVADSPDGKRDYSGFLAYQLWRSTMFSHLVSWRNRILVPLDKLRSTIFGRELSRF